jgi:hypothetical protein
MERDGLFWAKVKQGGPSDCWPWLASKSKDGYGQFWIGDTFVPAHRYAYAYSTQEYINSEDIICHHCDNPGCCNPGHLFKGTVQSNVTDKMLKGRHSYQAHPKYYEGEVWLMRRIYEKLGNRRSKIGSSTMIAKMFKGNQGTIWRLLHNNNYTSKDGVKC